MEWLLFAMVVIPLLTLGGGAAWWLSEQARRNQLLGGDPEVARLAARAEAAVLRLTSGPGVTGLPGALGQEVRERATELVRKVLPDLLARRRSLVERLSRTDVTALEAEIARFESEKASATDPETARLLETNLGLTRDRVSAARGIKGDLRRIDLAVQALVSNVEALEERFASGGTALPGAQKLDGANRLLEELKQVQEELKQLESSVSPALPASEEPDRRPVERTR